MQSYISGAIWWALNHASGVTAESRIGGVAGDISGTTASVWSNAGAITLAGDNAIRAVGSSVDSVMRLDTLEGSIIASIDVYLPAMPTNPVTLWSFGNTHSGSDGAYRLEVSNSSGNMSVAFREAGGDTNRVGPYATITAVSNSAGGDFPYTEWVTITIVVHNIGGMVYVDGYANGYHVRSQRLWQMEAAPIGANTLGLSVGARPIGESTETQYCESGTRLRNFLVARISGDYRHRIPAWVRDISENSLTRVPYIFGGKDRYGDLDPAPRHGGYSFVGYGSCVNPDADLLPGYQMVRDWNISHFFALGDTPYADRQVGNGSDSSRWEQGAGYAGGYADYSSATPFEEVYDYLLQVPGWAFLADNASMLTMWDDHEVGNDWDHSLAQTQNDRPLVADQAESDQVFAYAREAFVNKSSRLVNTDPEADDYKPSSAAAGTPASNYGPLYYRVTIGNTEFFVIDCISHRCAASKSEVGSDTILTNANAKTQLGKPQLEWLMARLAASTATYKVIASPKKTFKGSTNTNNIDWHDYQNERDYLIDWIDENVTGVVWLGGDAHGSAVVQSKKHLCVSACPLSQADYDASGAVRWSALTDNMAWCPDRNVTGSRRPARAYGLIRLSDPLRLYVVRDDGLILWQGDIVKGTNSGRRAPATRTA